MNASPTFAKPAAGGNSGCFRRIPSDIASRYPDEKPLAVVPNPVYLRSFMDLTELYQSVILENNRRPRNFRKLPTANRVASGNNPVCGDEVTVYVQVEGDRIVDISFQGAGCAISQASASVMTQRLKGKTLAEAETMFGRFKDIVTQGIPDESDLDLSAFAGVHQFPARIKCATLGWHAAINAVHGEAAVTATTE